MTHNDIHSFLKTGLLIRLPSGKVRLWKGPLKAGKFDNNKVFSVSYRDFFESEITTLTSLEPVLETEVSELRSLLQTYVDQQAGGQSFQATDFLEPVKEKFEEAFRIIQGKIHRGEIEKALPVVFAGSEKHPSPQNLAQMLMHVLEAHPDLYVFGMWSAESGILGATPEILFHTQGSHLRTVALAGTLPDSEKDQRKNLLQDPKELKEHQIVIDDLKAVLEKMSWVQVGETHILKLPGLSHLRTFLDIEGPLPPMSDLIKKLHPTPALGVAPRNYGIQWLKELPYQKQRGLFGAPIVFSLSHSEFICLVAIRCLQWGPYGSQLGSGCGIVESSEMEREWRELQAKRQSVFKVLGLNK